MTAKAPAAMASIWSMLHDIDKDIADTASTGHCTDILLEARAEAQRDRDELLLDAEVTDGLGRAFSAE